MSGVFPSAEYSCNSRNSIEIEALIGMYGGWVQQNAELMYGFFDDPDAADAAAKCLVNLDVYVATRGCQLIIGKS
jgi:hypothetical protein